MTRQVSLWVNDQPIDLDYFVSGFIDHTIVGMMGALKGVSLVDSLSLSVRGGEVNLEVNNAQVATNEFVSKIIKNTITGMVSTLKGVSKVESIRIEIKR